MFLSDLVHRDFEIAQRLRDNLSLANEVRLSRAWVSIDLLDEESMVEKK